MHDPQKYNFHLELLQHNIIQPSKILFFVNVHHFISRMNILPKIQE